MSGKCWVCKRQARGFGHSDGRFKIADPRRYPLDWVFCSRRCQDIFHTLYGRRLAAEERGEAHMVDASDIEIAAMRDCLKAFGAAAGHIGFDKPLGAYSEAEAMTVIDAIVTRYTEALTEHHERASTPPLRGVPVAEIVRDPFADLKEDLPWEEPQGGKPGWTSIPHRAFPARSPPWSTPGCSRRVPVSRNASTLGHRV